MKKLAISIAVATIVAAPLAQAGSSLTGSLRYGINVNNGDTNAFTIQNFGSRVKMAGDTAVGSNTGYGKLELRLGGARNDQVSGRMYAVGMKGGFGDLSVGLQSTAIGLASTDRTWWNGNGGNRAGDRDEQRGAILYKKSFGSVALHVGAALNDKSVEDLDIFDAAVKYSGGSFTIAAGMQMKEFDGVAADAAAGTAAVAARSGTATSVMGGYNFGSGDITVSYGIEDEEFTGGGEKTMLLAQLGVGNFYGWYGQNETDGSTDDAATNVGIGYTQKLSDQSLIWYELFSKDAGDGSDADTGLHAAYKLDF